jgi:uncharacterized membrane protein YphA (DoxX/SURF4 family)
MLTSYGSYDTAKKPEPHPLHPFRTVAVLRVGAAVVLFLQYSLEGILRAYNFVWNKASWELVDTVGQAGVPWPQFVLPAAALIAVAVSVAWMVGFLTRLFATVFLPVLLAALLIMEKVGGETHATVCWLYVFITITLMFYGSGIMSVDGLFKLGSRPRPKKR